MRYAIMGAGAIGGYIGGRLAASGNDVTLIARGGHLDAIRQGGLFIESPKGDVHVTGIAATDDPAGLHPVDCIIILVKNFDLAAAAAQMAPLVGPDTSIITFQNGVSAADIVGQIVGRQDVLPGVIRFPADIRAPGIVRHSAPFDHITFGATNGEELPQHMQIAADMEKAGLMARLADNILQEIWDKMTMQASFAAITALTRLDIGPIRDNEGSRHAFLASMAETEAVALAVCPDLQPGMAARAWAMLETLPPTVHSSMLDDLTRGKRIEIVSLSGEVARLGRLHKLATPLHDMFAAMLSPFENGAPVV